MHAGHFRKFAFSAIISGVAAWLAVPAMAQMTTGNSVGFGSVIHGVPPSVTSFNFGGQPGFHGVPASVTSLGFGSSGFHVNQGPFFNQPFLNQQPFFVHHHRRSSFGSPFLGDIVAVPYAYPVYVMEPGVDDSMEELDYRGGPTIFDRRGRGSEDYRRPAEDYRKPQPRTEEDSATGDDTSSMKQSSREEPITPQPQTVLVFKDGHQVQILNYAIIGSTLYDLSDGKTRKVALAELDLSATVKQNDERGVDFQLPAASKSN